MSRSTPPGIVDRGTTVDRRRRYLARFRPSGTDREVSRTFPTIHAANEWLAAQRVARASGTWVDPAGGKQRLEPFARKWLAAVAHEVKPSTFEGYRSLLESRVLPTFGRWQLAAIQPSDVRRWLGDMAAEGLSASRRRKCLVALRLVLDAAVADRVLLHNAARDVKAPAVPHVEAAYFAPAAVERLAAAVDGADRLLVLILGRLGVRFGEAVGLERRHVDVLRGRLRVEQSAGEVAGRLVVGPTKTYAARSVPVPPSLLPLLRDHLDGAVGVAADAPLFVSPRGARLRYRDWHRRVWRPALAAAGLPRVGVHVLRHSAAAALISAGASPKAVQTILGHRSAAFTLSVYGHMFDDDLDAVARSLDAMLSRDERGTDSAATAPSGAFHVL
jgi:integrase